VGKTKKLEVTTEYTVKRTFFIKVPVDNPEDVDHFEETLLTDEKNYYKDEDYWESTERVVEIKRGK